MSSLPKPYYERDGITIYVGDNSEILPRLDTESVSAVVSDPPSGISFMNANWDSHKGGRNQWIAWLASVLSECKRVMLPGAHALIWALPRTSGWTSMAIEDAGLDVRDCITHLFGSGFPKSHDVSKAIDRMAGAEREVVGVSAHKANRKMPEGYDGWTGEDTRGVTAPATPEAVQWQGWGTALKPAAEFWYLARKPFKGTVAANVLTHGTGAINVDACRIGTSGARNNGRKAGTNGIYGHIGSTIPVDYGKGRWPSNVILDEAAAEALDAQSGVSKSGTAVRRNGNAGRGMFPVKIADGSQDSGYGDTGGASRFFKVVEQDTECLVCARTYGQKRGIMSATEGVASCDHASSAETNSSPRSQASGSVHVPAPALQPPAHEGKSVLLSAPASNAVSSSPSSPGTTGVTAPTIADGHLEELLAQRVRSAASLCDSCVTAIAQSLAAMLQGQSPESIVGLDCIPGSNASILTRSLASYVEPMVNTGIIPTTASLSILFGSVQRAIEENTSKALGAPSSVYAPTRFLYQSKSSRRERNAGLDGMPEKMTGMSNAAIAQGEKYANAQTIGLNRVTAKANHHPTVKPIALMRYLIQMVTPPGGIVLDPFMGSGSTLVAAAELGFRAIGIEMNEEYAEIAARRVDHALNGQQPLPLEVEG